MLYRRRQGLSLTETHKIVTPKPVVEHEVEYESMLVAFEDGDYSPEAVATAAQAGRAPAARHPRARDDHRARRTRRSTPRMPEQEAPRGVDDRLGARAAAAGA